MKRKIMSFGLLALLLLPVSAWAQLRPDNIDSVLQVLSVREKAQLAVGAGWGSMFQGLHIPFAGRHRVPGAAGETRAIGRQAGEGRDRQPADLLLSEVEQQLMEQASVLCREQHKRLVVVLNCAGEMRVEGWSHLVDGILMAWCPGQEGGYSILDVLRASTSIIR